MKKPLSRRGLECKKPARGGLGGVMEVLFLVLLVYALMNNKRRYYTKEELDKLKREFAERDGVPVIEDQRRPYRWWKFRVR